MTLSRASLLGALCLVSGSLLHRAGTGDAASRRQQSAPGQPRVDSQPAWRCTACAAATATDSMRGGYRGPDLMAFVAGGATDERLFDTIRKGVPGTEMPPQGRTMSDDDILQIIAYLGSLGTVAAPSKRRSATSRTASSCSPRSARAAIGSAARGGRLGPDLIAHRRARSRAALTREIRTPSEWMAPAFETVTLVTKDGQRIRGVKKNEDVFTIQVMDTRERIQGYLKANLQEVIYEKNSLMPAFPVARSCQRQRPERSASAISATLRGAATPVAPLPVALAAPAASPVITSQDLLDGLKDPTRWLTYRGDYTGQRHSPLTQITPENVDQLDGAVDVPDRHARQLRDDAARASTACCT